MPGSRKTWNRLALVFALVFAAHAHGDRVAAPTNHFSRPAESSARRVTQPQAQPQTPTPSRAAPQIAPPAKAEPAETNTPISVSETGRLSAEAIHKLARVYEDIFGGPDLPPPHPNETIPSFTGVYSATKPMGSSSVIGAPNFWAPPKVGVPPKPFHDLPDEHFRGLDCNYHSSETDLECMVCNIYFEARNQAPKGQVEVGQTVLTRVLSPHYPGAICQNVYAFKQFSWTLPSILRADQRRLPEKLTQVLRTVIGSAREALQSGPNGYDSYYAYNLVRPKWEHMCRPRSEWITFGAHRFCSVHEEDLTARN